MASFLLYLCITLFIIVSVFMILVVLIQKGRGGGLASAFGGAGGHTAFGSKTGDILTWVTAIIFAVFLVLAISLNKLSDWQNQRAAVPVAVDETMVEDLLPEAPATGDEPADLPAAPAEDQAPDATPAAPTPPAAPAAPAQPE